MIIISHTSRQGNVYERVIAAKATGQPYLFSTGFYASHWSKKNPLAKFLPKEWRIRLLQKRDIPGIPPECVRSHYGILCEISRMRFGAMLLTDILHDRSTARWLKRVHGQDKHLVLHAFQDSGTRSLAVTRAIGGVGILEVILPPAETSSYIDAEDSDAKENFVKNNDLRWIRLQKDIVNADIVLSQSVYTERYLKNNSNTGVRICQMPLGVDPVRFPFLQRRRGKTFTLGCVGQICFRKGADILSNIAKWISERDDTVLLIAGEVTDAAGKILVSGLPRHCQYFGKIADEDLAAFYQRCDAILIVSRAEGACNVIYEAMASGTPCIVSPAAQSIVKDRDNGVIVEGYKTENWLNALQAVMNDSSSLVSMSHNCSEVANEYSWDRYHIRLSELYKTLSPIV